jgi:restriction endonuclease Mrr
MIDFELGANTVATYSVKHVDSDSFEDAGAV